MTVIARSLAIVALLGVMLVVVGCGANSKTLTGQPWIWGSFATDAPGSETVVPDPGRYTIQFNDDGTFAAKVDCNQVLGTYTTGDGGAMTITPGPSTLVACPEDSLADAFLQGLQTTASYVIADNQLDLTKADGGTMTFDPQAASASSAPS